MDQILEGSVVQCRCAAEVGTYDHFAYNLWQAAEGFSQVHSKYLSTRQCGNDPVLNTDFFPLKLYVCRCKTAINENGPSIPCDLQLEEEIAKKEAAEANTTVASVCASYSEVSNQITLEEKRTIGYLELVRRQFDLLKMVGIFFSSSVLAAFFIIEHGSLDYGLSVSEGVAPSDSGQMVPLRSGHRPSRCISWNGYSHCFCRSYERGVACNDGISEVKVAVRQAYKSLLVEV
ncbi:unnamed protein product [Toxocara canis]|uniref:EGF-like domain-containing protein n=1 Tax=Toxocara canis TaxID=6265 RepID=A0A183V8K6_TOXCA|nr:unnamed protein product [Toxocara canis]